MGGSFEQHVEVGATNKTNIGPDAAVEDIPKGAVDIEPTVPIKPTESTRARLGPVLQGFRIHENAGEVHFHEKGGNELKVAMPVAEFWNFWNKISNLQIDSYCYLDPNRFTLLQVTAGVDGQNKLDIRVTITKEADGIGVVFGQLESFVEGLRNA